MIRSKRKESMKICLEMIIDWKGLMAGMWNWWSMRHSGSSRKVSTLFTWMTRQDKTSTLIFASWWRYTAVNWVSSLLCTMGTWKNSRKLCPKQMSTVGISTWTVRCNILTLATTSGFKLSKTRKQEILWKLRPLMNWWSSSWWISRKKNIETVFVSLATATSSRSKPIWKLNTSTPWAKTTLMMRSNSTLRVFLLAVKLFTTTCDWRHCKVLSRFLLWNKL